MISAWWLIPAVMVAFSLGAAFVAVFVGGARRGGSGKVGDTREATQSE